MARCLPEQLSFGNPESVEEMVRAHEAGEPWFGRKNPGDHFVRLATDGGLVTARLMVPESAANEASSSQTESKEARIASAVRSWTLCGNPQCCL